MFQVADVWDEAKDIVGFCDDPQLLRWLSDAVTLIANKGDFEGWKGWIDICTADGQGRCFTLPREVETVLGVNIGGKPTIGYGQLFNFHLNGLGDSCRCDWSWQDKGGNHSIYRDLTVPGRLVAYVQLPADNGKRLIVYGYDNRGNKLRRQTSEGWVDGYQVPTVYGYAVPDSEAPIVARIDWVEKELTAGTIRLATTDSDGTNGVNLAVYEPDERFPQYRRIMLGRASKWIRVAYRRTNPIFLSRADRVPLKSRIAFLLAVQARKSYKEKDFANAHAFEADAARLEIEAQIATDSPTNSPIQVITGSESLKDPCDINIG